MLKSLYDFFCINYVKNLNFLFQLQQILNEFNAFHRSFLSFFADQDSVQESVKQSLDHIDTSINFEGLQTSAEFDSIC